MNRFTLKNIFLFDAIGALLSLSLTGGVLPHLSSEIGIRDSTLYFLALFPFVYCLYSFTCYFLSTKKAWMLIGILLANSFYVILSTSLIMTYSGLTTLGYLFLSAEVMTLICVIAIEWNVYRRYFKS